MAQDEIGADVRADMGTDVPADDDPNAIHFHYIKSAYFRVVHVDGAFGGVTARGYIHAAVFNERSPIPRVSRAPIKADNTLGSEEIVDTKKHAVREVEVDLLFDLTSAKSFRDWLDDKIKVYEKLALDQKEK